METGDKNREDFHCMEMRLVMGMWFILGDDWNKAQCLSRLKAFLPCKKSEFIFFVKTGYVSCLYDIVSRKNSKCKTDIRKSKTVSTCSL